MNMTKKVTALLLALMMVLSLAACGGKQDNNKNDPAPAADMTAQQVLDTLGEEELTRMILDLREPYKTPCRLVLLEQHTAAQAAQLCGRPPKTVEAQVYRGKKMLAQQILAQRENDERRSVHGAV